MFPKPRADLEAEHGRFRARAARQADRLSRVRRALAVPPGNQPDGAQCHWPGPRHACGQARRPQAVRRRPRLSFLLGGSEAGADDGPACGRRAKCTTSASPLSPMAYFAQFELEVEGVAMVTASHNDNGWTGIKMGFNRPLTFGPERDERAQGHRARGAIETAPGGRYVFVPDMAERYIKALTNRPKLKRKLKVVAACGNGTAGAFAPQVLEAIGCEVVPLDCDLDYTFPRYNPEPRRHEDAARHERGGARAQGRRRLRLRRRRRPLRRGRQRGPRDLRRQGRRDAGARSLGAARQCRVRRRREIDRPVHDRPGAEGQRRAHALLEDRPLLHEALHPRAEGAGRLREVRPLLLPAAARARATTTASSRRSPCATCSSAARASRSPISRTRCPRPGARPPCRRTAPTR